MSSFIFNDFKQRFLNGTVPSADNWKFTLMNKNFTEYFGKDGYPIEQYKTVSDFYAHNAAKYEMSHLSALITKYEWYKPEDTDEINKPMFITTGEFDASGKERKPSNWEKFVESYYYPDVTGNSAISSYLASGGFYYIRTKDELRWFANRSNSGNNKIIGVIGDGIDGVIRGQIGKDEQYPFEGILDGNGHTLDNVQIVCDNVDNGIVGVLGRHGVVRNFQLENTNAVTNLVCNKRINIQHIKDDARDICAGILVGRNYGTIENINAEPLNIFKFSGFVPEVYSVTNKADNYSDFSTIREKFDQGENFYFLNSWCINSPGNCCPYVGYFAEGLFAQRGDVNGNYMIEAQPSRKSKVATGLVQAEFNLKDSSIVAAAIYIKDYNGARENGYPWWDASQKDPWIWTTDDDLYGRNAVAILAYDITDTTGVKRRVWLEIHGMGYDKHSGSGKRRIHFMPGHINANFSLNDEAAATNDFARNGWDIHKDKFKNRLIIRGLDNDSNYAVRYPSDTKRTDWKAWQTAFIHVYKTTAQYPNDPIILDVNCRQTWCNDSFGDDGESSPDYVCTNDDIEVYASDGTPGLLLSQTMSNTKWSQRNKSSSSSLWSSKPVIFSLYLNEVMRWTETDSSGNEVKHAYGFKHKNGWPMLCHAYGTTIENLTTNMTDTNVEDAVNQLTTGFIILGRDKPYKDIKDGKDVAPIDFFEKMPDSCAELLVTRDSTGKPMSHNLDTYFAIRYLNIGVWTDKNGNRCYDDNPGSDDDNTWSHWEPTCDNNFNGELVYDGDWCWDSLCDYMKHRSRWWDPNHTRRCKYTTDSWVFRKNSYDDISINGDNAKDNFDGTVELQVVSLSEFQYRPTVHGDYTTSTSKYGNSATNPGLTLGELSASGHLGSSGAAIDYLCGAAKMYALNPNYYGLDQEGRWTTQTVRVQNYASECGNSENVVNYINFNWNIMRKQWEDWEDVYSLYDSMTDYSTDFTALYLDRYVTSPVDIPHAVYDKPVRMHDMGRAAYYISPIAGANYGRIQNVIVSATRENAGNFVGFIGSIAGKQERGEVLSSRVWALDHFYYFEDKPPRPDSATFTTEDLKIEDWNKSYLKACEEWSAATAAYNYEVRYKTTPIIPEAVAGDNSTLVIDPDETPDNYEYYPATDYKVDEDDIIHRTVTYYNPNNSDPNAVSEFYDPRTKKTYPDIKISSYKCNPKYKLDKAYSESIRVLVSYTSAWYDDYDATATNIMDDTLTFKLKPIFNAGGLFGKYVPSYNYSVISNDDAGKDLNDPAAYTRGTVCRYVDVVYGLSSDVPFANITTAKQEYNISALDHQTHDIHNSYGAIAGAVDLETSNVGQFSNILNKLYLKNVNVSSYSVNHAFQYPLSFGTLYYKPTELNTVQATEGAGRGKGRCWTGIKQNTTYAIDYPIMSNRGRRMENSEYDFDYAPINQSSAAFFAWRTSVEGQALHGAGHLSTTHTSAYLQHIVDSLVESDVNTVNINFPNLIYCNPYALVINDGRRGPECVNSVFGSNTHFTPGMKETDPPNTAYLESLSSFAPTRIFNTGWVPLSANTEYKYTVTYTPNNIDCLKDAKIFNRPAIDDLYFSYSYVTTSSVNTDLSFNHKVEFTSAARDNVKLDGTREYLNKRINIGYALTDDATWEGDGFRYRNNCLRIGDSVSPNQIRENLRTNGNFFTSSVSAVQFGTPTQEKNAYDVEIYEKTDELQQASPKNQFGGLLVTDSKDRCVMWIDNEKGTRLEGNPLAIELPHVSYQGKNVGGLVMAIKGRNI